METNTKVSENPEEELMCILFASLISADNQSLTEEVKQEMISRYEKVRKSGKNIDWTHLIEPVFDDEKYKEKLANEEKQLKKDLMNAYYETLQKT